MNAFSVIPPCRHRNIDLTLWSLSFARRGDGNLTLSLCDVPLLAKGEGCFGESQNRVRSHGLPSTFLSFRTPVRNPQHGCFAALSMTGWGQQTSPSGPSPCKRRGMFWRKPKQGEVARSSKHFFVIPSIFFCHSKCSFLSFQA